MRYPFSTTQPLLSVGVGKGNVTSVTTDEDVVASVDVVVNELDICEVLVVISLLGLIP